MRELPFHARRQLCSRPTRVLSALAVALVVAVAGCGGDDDDDAAADTTVAETTVGRDDCGQHVTDDRGIAGHHRDDG